MRAVWVFVGEGGLGGVKASADIRNDELLKAYKQKVKEVSQKYLDMIDKMYAEKQSRSQFGRDVGAKEECEIRKKCDEELRELAEEYKREIVV